MYLGSPIDVQTPDGELYLGHARCTWGHSLRKIAGSPLEIYGRATVQAIVKIPAIIQRGSMDLACEPYDALWDALTQDTEWADGRDLSHRPATVGFDADEE